MTEKIAIVGVGAMGGAIAKGLYNTKQYQLLGLNPVNPRVTQLAEDLEMTVVNDPAALVNLAPGLVILTTPAPLTVATARSLANLPTTTPVVSAAAGITQEQLQAVLGDRPLATMIPNTPVAVNAGAIGLALPQEMVEPAGTLIKEVLGSLGTVIEVKEADLDVVGVIGGCGPAFVDVMMDARAQPPSRLPSHRRHGRRDRETSPGDRPGPGPLARPSRLAGWHHDPRD